MVGWGVFSSCLAAVCLACLVSSMARLPALQCNAIAPLLAVNDASGGGDDGRKVAYFIGYV